MSALALLRLGQLNLALPYAAIAGIENISDAQPDSSNSASYWQLQRGSQRWSLVSLDAELQPQRQLDSQHRLALCFKQFAAAISCSSVESIRHDAPIALPAPMRMPGSCVRGLIQYQGELALLVDAEALNARVAAFFTVSGARA